jgi:transcription elongation factor Elf1
VKHWQLPVIVVTFVVAPAISSFARSSHSSSSANDFSTILVIGVVVMVGLAFAVINASRKPKPVSPEKLAEQKAEAMDFLDKLNTGKFTPPDTSLVLAAEEIALLNEPSRLAEARSTRVYAGGGTRVKGIYIGGGQSSSVQALKELDSGMLTLTTKRLVFTGSMESRVASTKDIVSVENFADAIEISTAKRAKRQVYFVRNGTLWGVLVRTVVKGGVSIDLSCSHCGQPVTVGQKNCPNCNKQIDVPRSYQDAILRKQVDRTGGTKQLSQPEAEPNADIRFNCPVCGQQLSVEERGAGMKVNCPSCNEQIEIPHTTASQ